MVLLKILYALIIADLTLSLGLILAKGEKFTLFSFINYEFAFLSTLLIVFLSFLSYKKGVLRGLKDEKFTEFRAENENERGENATDKDDASGKSTAKSLVRVKKFTLFFNLAKIAAYFLLALGFVSLSKYGYLDILAFLMGASGVVVAVFAYMILLKVAK